MNESIVTIAGNVATDLRHVETDAGVHITSFRLASTPRRHDRARGWVDGETSYVTVTCWRALAQNAASSLSKGDPVFVTGPMRVRQYEKDGRIGHTTEVDARVIGHDLNRGRTRFERVVRARAVTPEEEAAALLAGDLDDGDRAPQGVDPLTGEIAGEVAYEDAEHAA